MEDRTQSSAPVATSTETDVERLTHEVDQLRAKLEAVHAQVTGQNGSPEPGAMLGGDHRSPRRRLVRRRDAGDSAGPSGVVSRRRLFGLLGGAAAAGAGLAVVGSAGDPAGAVNPSLILDQSNVGMATTDLTAALNGTNTLTIENTDNHGTSGALFAETADGTALFGQCDGGGAGVYGLSASGYGGRFQTNSGGAAAGAQLVLSPGGAAGAPTGGGHAEGELWLDVNSTLWLCTLAGPAGTWTKLSSPLVTIAPARVYDSRVSQSPSTGPKTPITNGSTVTIDVTGVKAGGGNSGVPAGASAVLGNVTVVNGVNPGVFLTVYASGTSQPATSSVNAGSGGIVANNFTSQIGTTGMNANRIAITCGGGPTDFIVDIVGYYP